MSLRSIVVSVLSVLSLASLAVPLSAQVAQGGVPVGSLHSLSEPVPTATMPAVPLRLLQLEDAQRSSGEPYRFAFPHGVALNTTNAGAWEDLPSGGRVWRLRVASPGAHSLMLTFTRYQLPVGASLFVHDDGLSAVRGAFTHEHNQLDGTFAVSPTPGDALTLELYEPAGSTARAELELGGVLHDYVDVLNKGGGNGSSDACELDVACPEGAGWEDQARSTVMIYAPFGTCCSGVLLNNTNGDATPYLLTANHCGNLNAATFQFNWKRPACGSGDPTSQFDTIQSSVPVASSGGLDFQLLRLSQAPPTSYDVFYSGWDWSDVQPTSAVTIHHPQGDVMKISVENNQPRFNGTNWKIRAWDKGATEPGSSGSPLFDPAGRVIGQLRGGAATCASPVDDFYGRLNPQWAALQPFLDPQGTGLTAFDGLDAAPPAGFAVTGVVPAVVPLIQPGTQQTMQVAGNGFTPQSTLALDGVPLPVGTYTYQNAGRIDFDLPQAALGQHTLSVSEGGQVDSATILVFDTKKPIHQAGTGDPGNVVTPAMGICLTNADTPGHTNVTLWSLSPLPSIHPLIELAIGNGFTEIMRANAIVIPADGFSVDLVGVTPNLIGRTVYSQSFCAQCPFPATGLFPVSNLQSTRVQ